MKIGRQIKALAAAFGKESKSSFENGKYSALHL